MNPQGKGKIEWTDYTWSPVTGCKHGCSYCYANRIAQRIYPEKFAPTFRPERLGEPAKLKKPSKIFVCDMGDLFGVWVPEDWIYATLKVVQENPQHTFQFLTKNPWRYREFTMPDNCWTGTTIEYPTTNSPKLYDIKRSGPIRYISSEPLLGPPDKNLPLDNIDWIIIGELTGRALTQDEIHNIWQWAGELIDQAKELNIPVFVKNQLGHTYKQREWPR